MQYKCMVLLSSLIFSLYEPVGLDTCVVCVYLFMWLCAQIHVGVWLLVEARGWRPAFISPPYVCLYF